MRRVIVFASLIACAGSAAHAEGPGLKLSDSLVLHPGLAVGAGYDSNVFYSAGTAVDPATTAFYLDFRPSVDIATMPPQRGGNTPHDFDFRLHLGADLRILLPTNASLAGHNSYNADAGLALSIFPFGNYALDIFGSWVRASTPPYSVIGGDNINSDQGQFGLRLRIRPGGQRLEVSLQDAVSMYLFEGGYFVGKNSFTNDLQLRVSWKFFPKTALYISGDFAPYFYADNGGTGPTGPTPPNAYPLRTVAGLMGLITPTLKVNVDVGYGNSFTQSNAVYQNTASYNSVIAAIDATWQPTLVTALAIGYKHDFMQALIGTFYQVDSPYIALTQGIWHLTLSLRFSYEHRVFQGNLTPDGLLNGSANIPGRTDDFLLGHADLVFPIRDWIFIALSDDLQKNFSNCVLAAGFTEAPIPCSYVRNDVMLRLGVAY